MALGLPHYPKFQELNIAVSPFFVHVGSRGYPHFLDTTISGRVMHHWDFPNFFLGRSTTRCRDRLHVWDHWLGLGFHSNTAQYGSGWCSLPWVKAWSLINLSDFFQETDSHPKISERKICFVHFFEELHAELGRRRGTSGRDESDAGTVEDLRSDLWTAAGVWDRWSPKYGENQHRFIGRSISISISIYN